MMHLAAHNVGWSQLIPIKFCHMESAYIR